MEIDKGIRPTHIFLFFLVFYLLTFNVGGYEKFFYSVDGKVEYEQMKAIVGGNLSLLVSPHKHLGLSLAEIPFYLIGEGLSRLLHQQLNPVVTLLVNPLVAALLCLLVFLIVRMLSCPKTALVITFLYGFCTLVWPYSKSDVADPLFTLCNLAIFWALLHYNRSSRLVWFIISLAFMAATYAAKLSGHGFIFGWLFYVYITDRNNSVSLKNISLKFLLIILLWCLFIPLSLSVNQAHSQSYTWSWLHRFGYKFLVKEFSPLDGLFWYCPLLFLVLFSVRKFIRKFIFEFIFIVLLILPLFITLHLGRDIVCIYDFAGRYDMVYAPLLLIMLIPLIESFSKLHFFSRLVCIFIVVAGFYVQFLGSSVSVLYYSNLIGGGLGLDWNPYAFSYKYSVFNVYPRLILQTLTGLAVPIKGLNNTSASIGLPFVLDYFWVVHSGFVFKLIATLFLGIVVGLGSYILRCGQLISSLRKYSKEIVVSVVFLVVIWIVMFVPKELVTHTKTSVVNIDNPGFEKFMDNKGKIMAEGWELVDYSSQNKQPSVILVPDTSDFIEGKSSVQMIMNQDYVTVSLASTPFEVKKGQIIQASCRMKTDQEIPCSVRVAFNKGGYPFYYSPTTKIRDIGKSWKEFTSRVVVPKGARKANFLINVWAEGLKKGSKAFLDDVRIIKQQ